MKKEILKVDWQYHKRSSRIKSVFNLDLRALLGNNSFNYHSWNYSKKKRLLYVSIGVSWRLQAASYTSISLWDNIAVIRAYTCICCLTLGLQHHHTEERNDSSRVVVDDECDNDGNMIHRYSSFSLTLKFGAAATRW